VIMGAEKKRFQSLPPALLEDIVRRVLSAVPAEKIILFGSAAAHVLTPDSDIDLLIVQSETRNQDLDYMQVRRALRGLDYAFDLVFMSREWFEGTKNLVGGVAYPAHQHGIELYAARE